MINVGTTSTKYVLFDMKFGNTNFENCTRLYGIFLRCYRIVVKLTKRVEKSIEIGTFFDSSRC